MDKKMENRNARMKGNGDPYYEKILEKEQTMTQEEKAEEEAWWSQVSKKFKIRDKD